MTLLCKKRKNSYLKLKKNSDENKTKFTFSFLGDTVNLIKNPYKNMTSLFDF